MKTIIAADADGALTLPPHPKPHQRHEIAVDCTGIIVREEVSKAQEILLAEWQEWMEELAERRKRSATGIPGTPLQEIFDDLRSERY